MSFARKVWRLLVGIKDAFALLFLLLFFTALFAVLTSRPSPGQVREGALLLKLDGAIVEEASSVDPIGALLSSSLPTRQFEARTLVRAIDAAARDERIKAIALDLTTFTGGPHVSVKEVTEALGRFRTTEKPIIAYAVAYSDDAMMLAANASEIWIDPMGGAALRGPGGSILFYADAFERFNINAHVFQVGTYKGTGEPYSNSQMSPAFRENMETYVSQLWDEYRARLVQARPQADIDAVTTNIVASMQAHGGDMAQMALAAGLADTIGTYDEWGAHIAEIAGKDEWDAMPGSFTSTELDSWIASIGEEGAGGFGADGSRIGVITISGDITDGEAGPGSAGAARITRLLDDALDDDLAGLVVRVNSPGGTVTGSEAIRRSVLRYKAAGIPVAISMGNYAASGGYWIATAGDRIFAEPETVTGSIGIILFMPSFEGILSDYGINTDGVQTTPLSGQPDLLGGLSPEIEALLDAETNAIYSRFLSLVASSRGISPEKADELAQGRVWTGGSARQLGLVDQFGDLDAAMAWVAKEAGLGEDDWSPRFLKSPPDPFEAMLAGMMGGNRSQSQSLVTVSSLFAAQNQQAAGQVLRDLDRFASAQGAQALCLACMGDTGTAAALSRPANALTWWQRLSAAAIRQ